MTDLVQVTNKALQINCQANDCTYECVPDYQTQALTFQDLLELLESQGYGDTGEWSEVGRGWEEKGTGGEEKRGIEERKRVGMGSSREREGKGGRLSIHLLTSSYLSACIHTYINVYLYSLSSLFASSLHPRR